MSQMSAKVGVTDNLVLGQIDCWCDYLVAHWRTIIPTGVPSALVAPILRHVQMKSQ